MSICHYCGDEIEFRYKDGRPTPIHINGGWCSGFSDKPTSSSTDAFATAQSYVNPNAVCPVCKATVFFYQSPFGGRVFFDNLGWPWPKHGCTDHPTAQTGCLKILEPKIREPFRSKSGEILQVYRFLDLHEDEEGVLLRVFFKDKLQPIRLYIPWALLNEFSLNLDDLRTAPAFIIRTYTDHRVVDFIAGRKQAVLSLKVERPRRPSST